ncbi:hypothetical protein Moror_1375 [Moniliophthora roreri MCA 2997]|uniref:Uncharacterized protein n=1 Tax=Moniliophthora roreri (strain MCA 2997) TaxID=1381753 RepID=V2WQR9_MONRO|nr:hypothetical protein Moror_1375 [Moniliophthora roreri MCA 2997]
MIATTLSSLRPPHFKLWDLAIGDGLEYGHWRAGNQPGCGKRFRMAMIRSMQVYSVALLKKRAGRFSSSFLLQNYLVFAELKATAHEIERNSAPFTLTLTEWLLQSSRVFDALDVTEGKEKFFIVEPPHLTLKSTQCPRTFPTLHNAEDPIEETMPTPIYLFVHSLPTTLSEIVSWLERPCYFWSFDKTGQSRLSEEECERWGLPVLVPDTGFLDRVVLCSWPTHIYTTLQDWQKATGFDPTTSDWARSRGYPEWEIVGTEDRFVLVEEALTEDLEWEFLDV